MASDKEKISKGIRFLAVALPLVFTAPGLFYILGIPAYKNGSYLWLSISIVLMLVAVFFMVKGLRTVLAGFFNEQK